MDHWRPGPGTKARRLALALAAATLLAARSASPQQATQGALAPDVRAEVDRAATRILSRMDVPSVSVAIVRDGRIAYLL
jgi:CubicO group peptidase (beta-lactamase class C family)